MPIIRRKKKEAPPTPETPESLKRLSDGDLFVVGETSLIQAGYYLTMYRTSGTEERLAALEWLHANLSTAIVACEELQSRNRFGSL